MAQRRLNTTIILRNDVSTNWQSENPILTKGEIGIEINTKKIKIGDGVSDWNTLDYAAGGSSAQVRGIDPSATDTEYELGTLWINSTTEGLFYLFSKEGSAQWKKLVTEKDLENISDYITAEDLPDNIPSSKIEGLGTAAGKDTGITAGSVPVVGPDGKLDSSIIPDSAFGTIEVVDSEEAMLALSVTPGSMAVRTDENKTYILKKLPATELENWVELVTAQTGVTSVNSKTGAVVLTTDNISEGETNQYYTEERAKAVFESEFTKKASTDLTDSEDLLRITDTFVLDGGNA